MDVKEFNAALERHVRLDAFPLAIRMVAEGEELPPRTRVPTQAWGKQVAICQGLAIARRYGWTVAVGREDVNCPPAKLAFGFEPEVPYYTDGLICAGMYTETAEAGARTEAEVAKFEHGQYRYLLAAPLHRAAFEPDLILVYGNSAQVMRLLTAALWRSGGRIASSFSGRLDCSDIVIVTMQTGRCQVILPCYGDRLFAQTQDHEMGFTIPAAKMADVVAGLEGTHRGGVRYPTPSFLRYEGEFPESYLKLEEFWE